MNSQKVHLDLNISLIGDVILWLEKWGSKLS